MKNIEEALTKLPIQEPNPRFVKDLKLRLFPELVAEKTEPKSWFFWPSFALGAMLVTILWVATSFSRYIFPWQQDEQNIVTEQGSMGTDFPSEFSNNSAKSQDEAVGYNTAPEQDSQNIYTGYLRKSILPQTIYQLEQGNTVYLVIGESYFLENYLNQNVSLNGYIDQNDGNSIQLIHVIEINPKE